MYLYLCSQDLQTFDIALIDQQRIVQQVHIDCAPEQFLSALDTQLNTWNVVLGELQGIAVVAGPGSFTSSRLSVTLVNAIAFRYQIPVTSIENSDRLPLETLLETTDLDASKAEFAYPVYDRPPHIT